MLERKFEELLLYHPVLPLVVKSGDVERENNYVLRVCIKSRASTTRGIKVNDPLLPMSLTNFYHLYAEVCKTYIINAVK